MSSTDLTDGTVHGTMAAGPTGMIHGTIVMPVGMIHGSTVIMAGVGLTVTDGTICGDRPTIITIDIAVGTQVQPITGPIVAAVITMRQDTDQAMVVAPPVAISQATAVDLTAMVTTMHGPIL